MRENLLVRVALLGLMMPFVAIADRHEAETHIEKRVMDFLSGDGPVADIMAMVEAEIGDERDVEIYVTKDEKGEIRLAMPTSFCETWTGAVLGCMTVIIAST